RHRRRLRRSGPRLLSCSRTNRRNCLGSAWVGSPLRLAGLTGWKRERCVLHEMRWRDGDESTGATLPLRQAYSEFAVVAFFERVEQVRRGVRLAVVLDLFVAFDFHHGTVFELEAVGGVLQIMLLDQYSLEGRRIEAERGAPFETLLVGVAIDVLEVFVR